MNTRESWRGTYTYKANELIEYLREMRRGEFKGGFCFVREVYIQAEELGLIKMPNDDRANYHLVPFTSVTVIDQKINKDEVTP